MMWKSVNETISEKYKMMVYINKIFYKTNQYQLVRFLSILSKLSGN